MYKYSCYFLKVDLKLTMHSFIYKKKIQHSITFNHIWKRKIYAYTLYQIAVVIIKICTKYYFHCKNSFPRSLHFINGEYVNIHFFDTC